MPPITPFERPSFPATRLPLDERLERSLLWVDRFFDRVYSSRYNPLYQSGTLAVGMLLVMIVTGIYLLIFYKTGAPYDSVAGLQAQAWGGRWIRSLHRYSADLAMVAVGMHLLRTFLQGRTWGPRALAWISGLVLLGMLLLSGWTGLVLVWDVQGQAVAMEGAKLLDLLPLFSEPISRSFVSTVGVDSAFFFLNLFVHIALPLAMALALWLHTLRVARPRLLPTPRLWWSLVAALVLLSLAMPVPLPPRGDLLRMMGELPVDAFYAFWVPLSRGATPWVHLAAWAVAAAILVSVPWWWRPRRRMREEPSFVDERFCTGCTQCYLDCPYEAIAMVPREVGQGSELVARVDLTLCVSCGICAGSCAPMQIGPPHRNGREQLKEAEAFVARQRPGPGEVVVFGCRNGAGDAPALAGLAGVRVQGVACAGQVHTSVMEYLLRRGVGGIYLLACPERNCLYREGPKWLRARVYDEREAELQERVDRRRIRIGNFSHASWPAALEDVRAFQAQIATLRLESPEEGAVAMDAECDLEKARAG